MFSTVSRQRETTGQRLWKYHLSRRDTNAAESVLTCTTPFYAPVAERWLGSTVYYLTDLTAAYPNTNPDQIVALDRRMCRIAKHVFPNAHRISDYLINRAGCPEDKITIIPNATHGSNLLERPLSDPIPPPKAIEMLRRPVIGVIGNLAESMDWTLLRKAVELTPGMSWAFVGPTDMEVVNRLQKGPAWN